MKLEGFQENFKVTLLERPPEKSCSTSFFRLENDKVQKVCILFSCVYLYLGVIQLRYISGLASKSFMGFKFGF